MVDLPENHGALTLIILAPEFTPAIAERFHISCVLYNLNVPFERLSAVCFFDPGQIRLYMKRLCLFFLHELGRVASLLVSSAQLSMARCVRCVIKIYLI